VRLACVNQDTGVGPNREKGAAVHLREMRSAFSRLGAEVTTVDHSNPIEVRRHLEQLAASGPLDLVYERYALGAFAAGRFAREHGLPHVLEVNAPLSAEARRYRPLQQRPLLDPSVAAAAERDLFASADLVLAVSTAVGAFARDQGTRADHIAVRPNGVDTQLFRPLSERERASARQELALTNRFVLGFHGRLRPWHNLELLGRAAARLIALGVPAHVLTIGVGEFEEALGLHLAPNHWTSLGWRDRDEIARLVPCFDVLPLTYAESQDFYFSPLKLLEGMGSGVVPVVPNLGDLAETVTHGRDGLVYAAGDEDALVEQMRLVHDNQSLRERLSKAGRVTAKAHSWDDIARSVLSRFALLEG